MLPHNKNKLLDFDINNIRTIHLAGGCFWGVDAYMARVYGVYYTQSGYANCTVDGLFSYKQVCAGNTGCAEAVLVQYDVSRTDLTTVLLQFFDIVDPTTLNYQAGDKGTQYRSGIYYTDDSDGDIARTVIESIRHRYDKPIVTEVVALSNYCAAEEYHQNYLEKNPEGYCHVKF